MENNVISSERKDEIIRDLIAELSEAADESYFPDVLYEFMSEEEVEMYLN